MQTPRQLAGMGASPQRTTEKKESHRDLNSLCGPPLTLRNSVAVFS